MSINVHPAYASACLLAAASLSVSNALAQSVTLKETVVSATRFVEPAASLPLGVSVISAEEIRASGATTVNDALVRLLGVPGRQDLFNGGDTNLDLRGFGATAQSNQIVILDGVRLNEGDLSAPRMAGIPIESVERVEVLRGSGAVLYGEGATGGVIIITTKAGSGKQQATGGTAYAGVGSDGLREVRASGVVSTANGFSFDAYAQKRQSDGFRANQASDLKAGEVGGQWSSGWLRLGARFAQDDLDARLPGALSAQQFQQDPSQSDPLFQNDFAHIRSDRTTVFAQAELGSWQLAYDGGRREKKLRSLNFGAPFDFDVEASSHALRARQDLAVGTAWNVLVLGLDASDWERRVLPAAVASQQSRAFYAKDDVILQNGTRFTLGARTERADKNESVSATTLDDRENAWELGASHPFAPGWTGYARVGRSFRLANVDEFSFTSPGVILKPQVSRDTEFGVRWEYAAGSLQARLYRSALTNEIGFDPDAVSSFPTFPGANVNFDPTRRQGVELDWNHVLTSSFAMRINAAAREASFRSGSHAGKDVPLVPHASLALRGDWTPLAGHRFNAGLNWVSSQHPDFENTCRMPSYTTADARYAWQFHRNAELALGVTNLFDRKYFTQAFGCVDGQTTAIFPEAGRQYGASLRMQF